MVRRSESQFKADDRAYPIRVKFKAHIGGTRMLGLPEYPETWLRRELPKLAWSWGPAQSVGSAATAYYFRSIDDAQRFVAAFPQLELADAIDGPVYTSPAKSGVFGPRP
ncbi:hypothetical protein [Novosphingobium sp. Gsoil 351]|uniref:hypothetical protein n=1 Tax=Novosphingobium sp. Gsoil 351 TaxID=2675225 RepID=UPI0012B50015|nr:hypothetical protein [Novosphingobium sp. Gsoil 351]QGN54071.1 hypothetical protein GKE62_05465 [Novosphingobium sp. Gsoil 351]